MNIIFMWSVVLGIAASVVPNLIFKHVFFSAQSCTPKQAVNSFYFGAALKFVGLILLFSLFLNLPNVQPTIIFWAFLFAEVARLIWIYVTAR